MANSSAIDHHCKFANNTVFMFQIMNVVKSVPFAPNLILNFHVHPQSNQKAPIFGKLSKIHWPFSVLRIRKWKLQNLQRIVQNSHSSPTLGENHTKFVQSVPISHKFLQNFVHFAQSEINPG